MDSNSVVGAVNKSCLTAIAEQVVQEDGTSALAKECTIEDTCTCIKKFGYVELDSANMLSLKRWYYFEKCNTCWRKSQLPASHGSIKTWPEIVTHCSPDFIPANLHTSFKCIASIHQPDVSILTNTCGWLNRLPERTVIVSMLYSTFVIDITLKYPQHTYIIIGSNENPQKEFLPFFRKACKDSMAFQTQITVIII